MQKRILIVDDNRDTLWVLGKRLSNAGYLVSKAENGKQAIEMAKGQHPSLIVLDILMPQMDGAEAAGELKASSETKDIPIIFLTCLLKKQEEKSRNVIGDQYFIAKPYNPNELLRIVRKHTGSPK